MFGPECQRQWSLTVMFADPEGSIRVDPLQHYYPAIALYARPAGEKALVRVGWLLRCGHTIIERNLAEELE